MPDISPCRLAACTTADIDTFCVVSLANDVPELHKVAVGSVKLWAMQHCSGTRLGRVQLDFRSDSLSSCLVR